MQIEGCLFLLLALSLLIGNRHLPTNCFSVGRARPPHSTSLELWQAEEATSSQIRVGQSPISTGSSAAASSALPAWLGLSIPALFLTTYSQRRRASKRAQHTPLRYKVAAVEQDFAAPAVVAPDFSHPPRAEREVKKLPFSGDEEFWDFNVYPKALFPWSPEAGGRPWDSITDTHKVRLAFVAAVHLGCLAAPFTFSWGAFTAFLVLWFATSFGLCASFHRQLSHRAFECPKWMEYLFAYFACLAVEGGPIGWVRMHRYHHVHSDKEGDTHSPVDGFWWAHMGFMFDPTTPAKLKSLKNTNDLEREWFYRLMDDQNAYLALTVLLPVSVLCALGGLPYVIWGFFVRTVFVWHVNWGINSFGHVWGYQSYRSGDNSMNNPVLGLLGLGDGWHNNHHAFPRSCRHGLAWYEVDLVWYVLLALNAVGLAKNLQYPSQKRMDELAL